MGWKGDVGKTAATRLMARQAGKARHRQLIVIANGDDERGSSYVKEHRSMRMQLSLTP